MTIQPKSLQKRFGKKHLISIILSNAKVWKYIPKNEPQQNHWMWNVGKEPLLEDKTIFERVDSYRDWGDKRDLT